MFCKYCGKPVDETTMRCKICGRPVGQLEGGNGFWDLTGEKPAAEPAADNAALQELQAKVDGLKVELDALRAKPAAVKKSGLGALAALLALLALAVAVFALFQLRGLAGKLEKSMTSQTGQSVTVIPPYQGSAQQETGEQGSAVVQDPADAEQTSSETGNGEEQLSPDEQGTAAETNRLYTPWELAQDGRLESYELDDGITYVLWPDYFDGPRGENETKRQSITPRDPMIRQTDQILIFKSSFLGQHTGDPERGIAADQGSFDVYWARIELDENGKPSGVFPVETAPDPRTLDPEKDRFIDRIAPGNSHSLYIIGGAEDGEEGYYALIAEKSSDVFAGHYAYISDIIELYIPNR